MFVLKSLHDACVCYYANSRQCIIIARGLFCENCNAENTLRYFEIVNLLSKCFEKLMIVLKKNAF